jgi:hypothetical protein
LIRVGLAVRVRRGHLGPSGGSSEKKREESDHAGAGEQGLVVRAAMDYSWKGSDEGGVER